MAEDSWPSATHASGSVTQNELDRLIGYGVSSGLVGLPSSLPAIYADSSGMIVKIRADQYAKVLGRVWSSGSTITTKTISSNSSGQPRIDRVVLRYTYSTHDIRVAVIAGAPAATPLPPALTNQFGSGVWELPMAKIAVANGATGLAASTVTWEGWYLATDGSIVCESTTRPPLALVSDGTRITEEDTNRTLAKIGGAWYPLANGEDTGWQEMAAATGWAASVAQYRRLSGVVHLSPAFQRTGASLTTANADSVLTTLPTGYRPPFTLRYPAHIGTINGSISVAMVNLYTDGRLILTEYSSCANGQLVWPAIPSYVPA